MAERFNCDPEQAQMLSEKLVGVNGRLASSQSVPQFSNLGAGSLDSAMSEFSTAVQTAHQNLAQAVDKSVTNFSSLASGTTSLDQQEAERV